jgi:hypothetical protein
MTIRDAVDGDVGVLVIRVWREQAAQQTFRARITYGDDDSTVVTEPTTDPEEVVKAVRRWLDDRSRDHRKS